MTEEWWEVEIKEEIIQIVILAVEIIIMAAHPMNIAIAVASHPTVDTNQIPEGLLEIQDLNSIDKVVTVIMIIDSHIREALVIIGEISIGKIQTTKGKAF